MKDFKDIQDDQIRIVGQNVERKPLSRGAWVAIIALVMVAIVAAALLIVQQREAQTAELSTPEPALFEPIEKVEVVEQKWLGSNVAKEREGFTEIRDTIINDIPLRIFIPHNAEMSLHIGRMDKEDKAVVYVAQAADIRADNGGIVGAFVLKGEPRAWGLSKKGFCASINGVVTVGVAENSHLFEQATEEGGYFFRQYPLVSDGQLVENEPKGKSIRRAICDRQGEIFMIESGTTESFHDFAQALVDLGVDQAVYLVGSSAYGWAVDAEGNVHEFGEDNYYTGRHRMPKNTSYIVWRKQQKELKM
jgi:hypothetical protein